jgi:hypothetical protein
VSAICITCSAVVGAIVYCTPERLVEYGRLNVLVVKTYRETDPEAICDRHDLFCGLVVRVLGYRSGGPGWIPGTTRKKVVGLERGPLSLVSTTEELLDRKVAAAI